MPDEDDGLDFDFNDDKHGGNNEAEGPLGKTEWTVSLSFAMETAAARASGGSRGFNEEGCKGDDNDDGGNDDGRGGPLRPNLLGMPVVLLHRNAPQGFANALFATSVLDRFPSKNYKGLPCPEEELPMFCYPTGCRLRRCPFKDAPLAKCYGFVVKNERGDSIHGERGGVGGEGTIAGRWGERRH